MKNIYTYKQFESLESDDDKENLEFILLDLKDLGLRYSIFGKSKFLDKPSEDWYKNTKVERGFKDYLNLSVQTKKIYLDEILNTLKECINYMVNSGWKYHTKIDRGARIEDVNLKDIPSLFDEESQVTGASDTFAGGFIPYKYLGQIHIHFWK